ncbi:sigma-54 interaction domain-containing protein [Peribacillus loiseleuriae]|uniref:sigma-54 interaction domain-containing protein n=1 Tax=Peribacillus loiseleuriae TaxID=1679170 RepID=UPI00380D2BCF
MNREFYTTREVLEAILTSIDEGIHVIDTKGYTIFYNKVAAERDRMKVEEVLGEPLTQSFPSLNRHTSTLLQVIERAVPIKDKRQSYMNIHGKMIETINTTLPLHVNGELFGAIEIAKDYSNLKALSERLLDLKQSDTSQQKKKFATTSTNYTFSDLLTVNPIFLQVIHQGKKAANSDSSVLVYGESGVGKELFVQGIHAASTRSKAPFIAQNCAALPESLLESLLFGTAKGSYTGAVERAGLFELANGGTLFLDELQSMSLQLQTKLLRVLEDGLIRRIGGIKNSQVDVRIMAAMNMHPEKALSEQLLRPDLYYRLNVLSYELPSLNNRPEDIELLAHHFISYFNKKMKKHISGMEPNLHGFFNTYKWPGNVRELKHTIEYMMNIAETNFLQLEDLPPFLKYKDTHALDIQPLREVLKQTEEELISNALTKTKGNILQAAKLLQIPRQTLQYKLNKIE